MAFIGVLALLFQSILFGILMVAFGVGIWATGGFDKKARDKVIESKDKEIDTLKAQLEEKDEIASLKTRLAELEKQKPGK